MPLNPPTERRGWRKLAARALDFLYPPSCTLCRENLSEGRALCDACAADLPRLTAPFCHDCGEAFPGEIDGPFACPNCQKIKFAFEFARPALVRDERTLEMIHRLKYRRELHLAQDLGRLAAEAFSDPRLAPALAGNWPLVPVPLHRKREQNRHFNQASEIARSLAAATGLPVLHALKRIRATEHQTSLSRAQRMKNLKGAFALTAVGRHQFEAFPERGAILIDDVFTTGSTVHECAKMLQSAGVQRVAVVTVMRG